MKERFSRNRISKEFYQEEWEIVFKKAYEKSQAINSANEINPEEFIDLYGEETVNNDRRYVEKTKESFPDLNQDPEEKKRKMAADILEAIIFEQGEQSDWFGPNATTIKTSEFDDFLNKIDSLIEFVEEDNDNIKIAPIAFGIDVTYADSIHEKFQRIKDKIDDGQLAKVKYYISGDGSVRGELSKIPLTVISVTRETVGNLSAKWITTDKRALVDHWVQFQILEELIEQCRMFAEYAEKTGKVEIAKSYSRLQKIITKILNDKKEIIKDTGMRDKNFTTSLDTLKKVLSL